MRNTQQLIRSTMPAPTSNGDPSSLADHDIERIGSYIVTVVVPLLVKEVGAAVDAAFAKNMRPVEAGLRSAGESLIAASEQVGS